MRFCIKAQQGYNYAKYYGGRWWEGGFGGKWLLGTKIQNKDLRKKVKGERRKLHKKRGERL